LGDQGVDGRIILRWIFRKWDVGAWTGLICLRRGSCACGNELSSFIKCEEFLGYLRTVSFSRRALLYAVSK
jgi:hypothetical protein